MARPVERVDTGFDSLSEKDKEKYQVIHSTTEEIALEHVER